MFAIFNALLNIKTANSIAKLAYINWADDRTNVPISATLAPDNFPCKCASKRMRMMAILPLKSVAMTEKVIKDVINRLINNLLMTI